MARNTILILFVSMSFAVFGCGGDSSTPPTTADTSDTSDVTQPDTQSPVDTVSPPPLVEADPIRILHSATLNHVLATPGGVAKIADDRVAICDGPVVRVHSADQKEVSTFSLPGTCLSVIAHGDSLIVSEDSEEWVHINAQTGEETARYAGEAVFGFATDGTTLVGFAGQYGLFIGTADGSTPPTTSDLAKDARTGLFLDDGSLLIADGRHGLKHVTMDAAGTPTLQSSLETEGMALGLSALSDGDVAVAHGEWGLLTISTTGEALATIGSLQIPGMSTDVAVVDAHLLLAGWDAIRLIDITDRTQPTLVARELFVPSTPSNGRALAVETVGDHFFIVGNEHAHTVETQLDAVSPEFSPHQRVVSIEVLEGNDGGSTGLLFYNTGKKPLIISNIQSSDERILVCDGACGSNVPEMVAEADSVAFLEIQSTTGDSLEAQITAETNDPDAPTATFPIRVNPTLLKVGDPAPNFVMPGVYGEMVQLADLKGQVVYLKLFNSL